VSSTPFWTTIVLDNNAGPDGSAANGCFEVFGDYATFVSNIPINDGHYVSAAATVSAPSVVRVAGQKDATHHRAHLWIQNRKHTWCGALEAADGNDDNDIANCPFYWDDSALSGTVTVGGFVALTLYTVEYTTFTENGVATVTSGTQLTDVSGNMVINLALLASSVADVGVKIGTYP
jgi:hypothetical protein